MKYKIEIVLFLLIAFLYNCNDNIVQNESKDYTKDFDSVWVNFDKYYPLFTYKNIDWERTKIDYRDKFIDITAFQRNSLLVNALSIFKDEHIYLNLSTNHPTPTYINSTAKKNYNKTYLTNFKSSINWIDINEFWGWGKKDNVGYIAFQTFGQGQVDSLKFDSVLENLKTTNGIIVDLRENYGGSLLITSAIVNRFTNKTIQIGSYIYRDGPNHDDFATGIPVITNPRGTWQYTKKVVVLIGRYTFSAGEIFAEVFSHFDNAVLIGDTTRGAGIIPTTKELPDGTTYMLPVAAFYDIHNNPLEWNGVSPQIYFNPAELENDEDNDVIINKSFEIIE